MHACPNCKAATISSWRKSNLGAGSTTKCPACGCPIGLSSALVIAYVPFFLALLLTRTFAWSPWGRILALALGAICTGLIQIYGVPLWRAPQDHDGRRLLI